MTVIIIIIKSFDKHAARIDAPKNQQSILGFVVLVVNVLCNSQNQPAGQSLTPVISTSLQPGLFSTEFILTLKPCKTLTCLPRL